MKLAGEKKKNTGNNKAGQKGRGQVEEVEVERKL